MRFIQEGNKRIQNGRATMTGTNIPISQVLDEVAGEQEMLKVIAARMNVPVYELQGTLYELSMLVKEKGLPQSLFTTQD